MDDLNDKSDPTKSERQKSVGMVLSEAAKVLHEKLRHACESVSMPQGYHMILATLARNDGVTQLEIAKRSKLKPPTVSVTLQKMETDGILIRETDPKDQRQVRVFITEKGKELNKRVWCAMEEVDKKFVKGFSPEEEAQLRNFIERLKNNLEGTDL